MECGTKIDSAQNYPKSSPVAERRQLTVLFCDLVGSTALSEQLDVEDYRQVILDYQQIAEEVIIQYGGHVAQYLGDGLLVYFGYPKGLENAPKASVLAGLGILEAIAKANRKWASQKKTEIKVRLGIHTGLVVVDEHLALGDTLNIAARLEGLAPINGLVISAHTYKLVQGWFEVKSLGKEILKGIKEPMEIFQVLKGTGASSRIEIAVGRGLSPLVDREEEVYMLLRNWNLAKKGKGQLLLLNGEAGIGKSRLVESLKGQVKQEQQAAKLELHCVDHHVNSPFHPLIALLEKRILRFEKEDSPAHKIAKLELWMEFAGIEKKPNLPIYADFLSIPISHELRNQHENALLVPAGKRKKFMEGFSTAVFNFSLQQPLLLVAEDLHWMDSSTLEWLKSLVEQINAWPVFILATSRPQFQAPWPNKTYISQLNLPRLNPAKIEAICYHQTRGKPLPQKILEQIKKKTDGVPLFVEELTRMMIESDVLIEKETHFEIHPAYETGFTFKVPLTLQDSLITRLDNLLGAKETIQIGATLGRSFSFELLQSVTQKEAKSLEEDLAQLVNAELLFQKSYGNQAIYIFKHALIQDTAYESLLRSKRQQLHQQVAKVLESQFPELVETQPELLAHHAFEAGQKEQALLMWEKAANKAIAQNATINATYHFQQALSLIESIEDQAKRDEKELTLLIPYNGELMLAKGWGHPEAQKNSTRILELCQKQQNASLACIGYYGLAAILTTNGHFDKAWEFADKGEIIAESNNEMDFRLLLSGIKGEINALLGKFRESRKNCENVLQQYDKGKHQFLERMGSGDVWVYVNFILFYTLQAQGYFEQAKQIIHEVQDNAKDQNNLLNLLRITSITYAFHFFEKNWKASLKVAQHFRPIIEESGELILIEIGQQMEAIASFANGSEAGFQKSKNGLQQLESLNFLCYLPCFWGHLAEACQINGWIKEGLACINEAKRISLQTNEGLHLSRINRIQGDLLIMANNVIPAEQAFHQALKIAQEQSAKWHELLASKSLTRLWQSQGKIQEAYDLLNEVYNWFTEGFDTIDMVEAKELMEELRDLGR